jgi:hypothetical protein
MPEMALRHVRVRAQHVGGAVTPLSSVTASMDGGPMTLQAKAEEVFESLAQRCICQNSDVGHWCESCQRDISIIKTALVAATASPSDGR